MFVSPPYQVGKCWRAVQAGKYSLPFLFLVWSVQPEIACKIGGDLALLVNVVSQGVESCLRKSYEGGNGEDVIHGMLAEAVRENCLRIIGNNGEFLRITQQS